MQRKESDWITLDDGLPTDQRLTAEDRELEKAIAETQERIRNSVGKEARKLKVTSVLDAQA